MLFFLIQMKYWCCQFLKIDFVYFFLNMLLKYIQLMFYFFVIYNKLIMNRNIGNKVFGLNKYV